MGSRTDPQMRFGGHSAYTLVSQSPVLHAQVQGQQPLPQRILAALKFKVFISFIGLLSIAATSLIILNKARTSSNHALVSNDAFETSGLCGNSSAEAKALGCTFDQLTWSWYPPQCPHYANDEFVKAEDWKFYLDMEGKHVAAGDDWVKAMDNEIQLWGQRREHITHCVYLMLSVGQIVRDAKPYAPKLVDYGHLEHCAEIMLKSLRKDRLWNSMETRVPFVDYSVIC